MNKIREMLIIFLLLFIAIIIKIWAQDWIEYADQFTPGGSYILEDILAILYPPNIKSVVTKPKNPVVRREVKVISEFIDEAREKIEQEFKRIS